jgi:hypothetical protein
MSKLSARQRANLPPSAFGLPERARTENARQEAGNHPSKRKAERGAWSNDREGNLLGIGKSVR